MRTYAVTVLPGHTSRLKRVACRLWEMGCLGVDLDADGRTLTFDDDVHDILTSDFNAGEDGHLYADGMWIGSGFYHIRQAAAPSTPGGVMRIDISTPLLLTILGAIAVIACFFVPGPLGIALAIGGNVLLFLGLVAALEHIGWL